VSRNILVLAGGGGHTGYAYALAQNLCGKASLQFLVPKGDVLSQKRLNRFGSVGFLPKPRGATTPTHKFALRLMKAFVVSSYKVSRRYNVVVSTGSNFCIPPAFFAWMYRIPVINIESSVRFTKPSTTANLLQPFSVITALQWEEQKRLLKGMVVGPLVPRPEIKPWNGGYILVTGGTYGHKLLFDTLAESDLENIVLQTGLVNPHPYIKRHPEWKVITYSTRFFELVAGAELVVTHFGSTILEALVYRKPTVIVPNPKWTRTAGIKDAEYFAKKVNAILVSEINLETLLEAMNEAKKRNVPILPDGAGNLARKVIELMS